MNDTVPRREAQWRRSAAASACKPDKSRNTLETASSGRAVMLDQPERLADKLLEATNKIPFQPGWEVSFGSWSCENVLREHLRFAGDASSGCVTWFDAVWNELNRTSLTLNDLNWQALNRTSLTLNRTATIKEIAMTLLNPFQGRLFYASVQVQASRSYRDRKY